MDNNFPRLTESSLGIIKACSTGTFSCVLQVYATHLNILFISALAFDALYLLGTVSWRPSCILLAVISWRVSQKCHHGNSKLQAFKELTSHWSSVINAWQGHGIINSLGVCTGHIGLELCHHRCPSGVVHLFDYSILVSWRGVWKRRENGRVGQSDYETIFCCVGTTMLKNTGEGGGFQ